MKYVFVALLALLCAGVCEGSVYYEPSDDWALLNCVEESALVVSGTVMTLTGFYHANIQGGAITTEVLVRITDKEKRHSQLRR